MRRAMPAKSWGKLRSLGFVPPGGTHRLAAQTNALQDSVEGRSVRFKGAGGSDKYERQHGVALTDGHQMVRLLLSFNRGVILQQNADGRVAPQVQPALLQNMELGI